MYVIPQYEQVITYIIKLAVKSIIHSTTSWLSTVMLCRSEWISSHIFIMGKIDYYMEWQLNDPSYHLRGQTWVDYSLLTGVAEILWIEVGGMLL